MTLHIATVMENAAHLNHPFTTASIKHKMPRLLYPNPADPGSAELKVVEPCAFNHHPRPFHRTITLRISLKIAQRLLQ